MSSLQLIATVAFGLEAVVGRELDRLGYAERSVADGRVSFTGGDDAICRANLWLRSADRVLLKMAEFEARDFGELFDQTRAVRWSDLMPADAGFPVRGKSVRSQLASVPDCQSIVKKAIVEQMAAAYGRSWFEETGARFPVEVSIVRDRVTLSVDTSGAGLHKRGYRTLTGPAPLKETLAAALVQLSYWQPGRPFYDPFCGTGTIGIEAALLGRNIAPGINRSFLAEDWPLISRKKWAAAREHARSLISDSLADRLVATDFDAGVLSQARHHARQAGVADDIHFQRRAVSELTTSKRFGCLICNPPYGLRSGEVRDAETVYVEMRDALAALENWSIYVLTSHADFERLFGRKADRRRKLYNGKIACTYYQFQGPRPPR